MKTTTMNYADINGNPCRRLWIFCKTKAYTLYRSRNDTWYQIVCHDVRQNMRLWTLWLDSDVDSVKAVKRLPVTVRRFFTEAWEEG